MRKFQEWSGAHDGAESAATLTDSGESFIADEFNGLIVDNETDGSAATITDTTETTIVGSLAGGTENDWDVDDVAKVKYGTYQSLVSKLWVASARAHMTIQAALEAGYIQLGTYGRRFCFVSSYDRVNSPKRQAGVIG